MATNPRKRSLTIAGHRTSLSLEDEFWRALKEVAAAEGRGIAELAAAIDGSHGKTGLSTAIRIYLLNHYRRRAK